MGRGSRQQTSAISATDIRAGVTLRPRTPEPEWTVSPQQRWIREVAAIRAGLTDTNAEQAADDILAFGTSTEVYDAIDRLERVAGELELGSDAALNVAMAADQMALACSHENVEEAARAVAVGVELIDQALTDLR